MILSQDQVNEILRVIQFQHTVFVCKEIGSEVLSDFDKDLLRSFDIDLKETSKKHRWTSFDQSFYLGRLIQIS